MAGVYEPTSDNFAKEAYEQFRSQSYDDCLRSLDEIERLELSGAVEVKRLNLELNRCLCHFAASGYRNVTEYMDTLKKLMANNTETVSPLLHLNLACSLWSVGSLRAVIELLSLKLLQVLERIDDTVTSEAVFLLVEIWLSMFQPEKASACINFIERLSASKLSEEKEGKIELQRRRLLLAKVRCNLMMRNHKVYRKDIKLLAGVGEAQQYRITLFKAQQEYHKGNLKKAVKYLSSVVAPTSVSESGDCLPMILNNAYACIYTELGKPQLSLVYMRRTVDEFQAANSRNQNETRPAFCRSQAQLTRVYLLHNMGVIALQAGQPQLAFDCLLEVLTVFNVNARVWLRLAEACVAVQAQQATQSSRGVKVLTPDTQNTGLMPYVANKHLFGAQKQADSILSTVIGNGQHRKAVLKFETAVLRTDKENVNQQPIQSAPSYEFAALCLQNALSLLPSIDSETLVAEGSSPSVGEAEPEKTFTTPPGNPIAAREVHRLKCAALCLCSYVHLYTGDYTQAYDRAKELLAQPFVSGAHKLLGSLYCAEALILLDQTEQALSFMNPETVSLLGISELWRTNSRNTNFSSWYPQTASGAQSVVLYNLALTHCFLGDYKQAMEKLQEINQSIAPHEMVVSLTALSLYIRLRCGQFDSAKQLILQNFPTLK